MLERKRLSGAQCRQISASKKQKQQEMINKCKKIDEFFCRPLSTPINVVASSSLSSASEERFENSETGTPPFTNQEHSKEVKSPPVASSFIPSTDPVD